MLIFVCLELYVTFVLYVRCKTIICSLLLCFFIISTVLLRLCLCTYTCNAELNTVALPVAMHIALTPFVRQKGRSEIKHYRSFLNSGSPLHAHLICKIATAAGTPATGNVIKPQCSSVPLATDAANQGPFMMRTRMVECGQEQQLFDPGEYPCVRRFRYRRLLSFLWLQGYRFTFAAYAPTAILLLCQCFDLHRLLICGMRGCRMLKQTNSYFCVSHLAHLVSQGQWTEALDYIIPRFLPPVPCSPMSLQARVLVKFLRLQLLFELGVGRYCTCRLQSV